MHNPMHFQTVYEILETRTTTSPDSLAIEDMNGSLTYGQLKACARELAQDMVTEGVGVGDRVFTLLGNSCEFAVAFWAVQAIGAVAVPLPPETADKKLEWLIQDAEPRLLLTETPRDRHDIKIIVPNVNTMTQATDVTSGFNLPNVNDLSLIIYTSGSTGAPKGVTLSQKNVLTAACSVATYLDYQTHDRVFCAIPFTFDYGLHQLTTAALSGGCVIAERDFSKPFLSLNRLSRSNATVLPLVPTLGALLIQIGERLISLTFASSPILPQLSAPT